MVRMTEQTAAWTRWYEMREKQEEKKKEKPPQVFIFSSAELTPFTLSFYPQDGDAENDGWRVIGKETGEIKLYAPGDEVEEDDNAIF